MDIEDEDENFQECQNCGAETSEIDEYKVSWDPAKKNNYDKVIKMCKLCAGSPAGNIGIYPWTNLSGNQIAKTICCVGNEILKAIKEIKNA